MSTKSRALFRSRKGQRTPQNLCPELCNTLIPPTAPGKIIFKDLPGQSSLSLRPVSLATDLPLIYGWITQGYSTVAAAPEPPLQQLNTAYTSIIASDFAQPFMGLVNDVPVCQVDIYKAKLDVISLYYESVAGDYGLHLLNAPQITREDEAALLSACVNYFFSFPEIGRIVTDVESSDKWANSLMKKLGFQWNKKIRKPYKVADLYICTRNSFTGMP
ncbi:MAG TPA: GNAT family N-acetyltransferase [Puia sp.]|nr:GNAT family N-acetyltransferase [Puia sp.]